MSGKQQGKKKCTNASIQYISAIYIEIKKKKKKACQLQKDEENCMGYTGALNIHYKG